jgi:hypothetical protein
MKNLILIFFFLLCSCNSNEKKKENGRSKFYRQATSNFSTSSYFIVLDVINNNDTFPIVIQNGDLYYRLIQSRIVKNEEDFQNKMLEILENNSYLNLNSKKMPFLNDYRATKNDSIDSSALTNSGQLSKLFFTDKVLIRGKFSFSKKKSIIYYLFKSEILCHEDCVTGDILVNDSLFIQKQ